MHTTYLLILQDPNWYKAENIQGKRGLAPALYLMPCTNSIRQQPHPHGPPFVMPPYDNGLTISNVPNSPNTAAPRKKQLSDMP